MYKNLSNADVTVTPYRARKLFRLGNDSPYLTFHVGVNDPEPFSPEESAKNSSGTYIQPVYEIVRHKYYREEGNPYERFGVEDPSKMDRSGFPRQEGGVIYVLKISSQIFGKRVDPGSFQIQSVPDRGSITVTDDGNGNLFSKKQNDQVGNIFYSNGLVVLTEPPSSAFDLTQEDIDQLVEESEEYDTFPFKKEQNRYTAFPDYEKDTFDSLFQQYEVEFRSVTENYEHEISADVKPGEFGSTLNPTAREDSEKPIKPLEDGDFRPYVTTVGYYNDESELIATAKLSKPIKLPENTAMTILARFDT
jgi:hypothetical protein